MYRGNFVEQLITYAFSTVIMATRIVFEYLLPPLFILACSLTRWIFLQMQAYIPLTAMHVILLASGGWALIGLCLPLGGSQGQTWEQVALFRLILGGLIGLCIGGQVARDWVTILPDDHAIDTPKRFGFSEDMFTSQKPEGKTVTIEDLLSGGVVMGEDLGHTSRAPARDA